jgi:uncharacterized Fe-S center protein
MAEVFFIEAKTAESDEALVRKIETLWDRAGLAGVFEANDLAALKLHVGEPGTKTFVPPRLVAPLVRCIETAGAKPFLTDTAVLYRSPRDNGLGHARVAHEHGFDPTSVGAPFIPADGLNGADEIEIRVDGRHFENVAIASAIVQARSMLVLSHATGHLGAGYGGAIKNLGMGCCSKKAKLRQHHGQQPRIDGGRCVACSTCAQWCPSDAIVVEETASIDGAKCIGCGECIAACLEGAVDFDWGIMGRELQERVVEHAAAVVRGKPGRIGYVTVALDITKNCDCLGLDEQPIVEDIGILASVDPVAIDRAVLDLIRERAGRTLEDLTYPRHDAAIQVRYAEQLGLGDASVNLITV